MSDEHNLELPIYDCRLTIYLSPLAPPAGRESEDHEVVGEGST
jgi:hypothetical protein